MSKKRKYKELDIQYMKEYIRKNLDNMGDQTVTRLYEAATGENVTHKTSDNKLRVIT
jgi:hypothetical protein|tara:strand:+ start:4330 stop:4500 length:171 start_codon:yes stop_codon:yes gene_type:complete